MNLFPRIATVVLLFTFGHSLSMAAETQRLYLSGRDKDNTVPWRFFCTSGANSGVWTNIPVPSNWDVKGFGTLTYYKDATNAWNERGLYEHDFAVPGDWTGKRVFLVFEGVMTDTSAKLNGESVGPVHQGGFYRFKYEVTKLVKFGATNRLDVDVARHSANESVNRAERLADYWVFAGIYRPVYLEAVPQSFIERVAIDAKADGSFAMDVFASGASAADSVEAQVLTLKGKAVGKKFVVPALAGPDRLKAELRTKIRSPKQWTAETPNLYSVEVRLKRGGKTIHTYKERFGFRTFEVRERDGLYLNGKKIVLKGVNRHSSWPDSGRCLNEAIHRLDIETIKDMNGNAVRMSHYPPDVEFLDLCDELGLYVLDELAGWQKYYDTPTGTRLAEAVVTRDVNHPSILFWDNGNEGGFNTNLDKVFLQFDPQQRPVLHPWAIRSGINTAHYLAYSNALIAARGEPMNFNMGKRLEELNTNYSGGLIYLPTEFMHGLYDGGAGAGLADYWSMMMSHSNCAGGFIWVFADEAVRRPDTGELDAAGNAAPDGIVGPYREREGSFYAIKEIWSPKREKRTDEERVVKRGMKEIGFQSNARIASRIDSFGSGSGLVKELTHKDVRVRIDAQSGRLRELMVDAKLIPLSDGPRLASTNGQITSLVWQFRADGWLQCRYTYTATGTNDAIGVLFDYPEQFVKRKRWLGDGPFRVWKNRLGGGTLGVWENDYNNTITGYRGWEYPEFKGFFAINPRVDDIPERFSVIHRGVRLLEMGSVDFGGSGCICPESAMLKTLFTHLLFRKDDVLLLDMYAGVEHLGRATVDFVDAMIVVVEPTRRSLGTAAQIKKLANDIKLDRLYLVGNKVRNDDEAKFLESESPDMPVLGFLPADMKVQEADRLGIPVYDHVPALKEAAGKILAKLTGYQSAS